MSDALIETGITIAARVLLASFEALAAKAKADEAAELTRMLTETKARLAAMPPIAESLDAITEKHLARVRNAQAFPELAALSAKDAAHRRLAVERLQDELPTESEDPDQ